MDWWGKSRKDSLKGRCCPLSGRDKGQRNKCSVLLPFPGMIPKQQPGGQSFRMLSSPTTQVSLPSTLGTDTKGALQSQKFEPPLSTHSYLPQGFIVPVVPRPLDPKYLSPKFTRLQGSFTEKGQHRLRPKPCPDMRNLLRSTTPRVGSSQAQEQAQKQAEM